MESQAALSTPRTAGTHYTKTDQWGAAQEKVGAGASLLLLVTRAKVSKVTPGKRTFSGMRLVSVPSRFRHRWLLPHWYLSGNSKDKIQGKAIIHVACSWHVVCQPQSEVIIESDNTFDRKVGIRAVSECLSTSSLLWNQLKILWNGLCSFLVRTWGVY